MLNHKSSEDVGTLFSVELLVECVRIENEIEVSDQLALGVRLLDYRTLLIRQPQQNRGGVFHAGQQQRKYVFKRGKSCFFKMNQNSLHIQLCNVPLYVMVLDMKEDIPKLVGTSLISLAEVMDRISKDVAERGASSFSCHGERGQFSMCSLNGAKIGSISLSYKLQSLGTYLLPQITDSRTENSTSGNGKAKESIKKKNVSSALLSCESVNVSSPTMNNKSNENNLTNEDKHGSSVCTTIQIEEKPKGHKHQRLKEPENGLEEDLSVFCPPHLFYCNTSGTKNKSDGDADRLLNLELGACTFEDKYSDEETSDNKIQVTSSLCTSQTVKYDGNRQASKMTPNVSGGALQQLPLLNALLDELSQLNDPNLQHRLSIQPHVAWSHQSISREPLDVQGNTAQNKHNEASQKKQQHSLRNCSTPTVRTGSAKVEAKQQQASSDNKRTGKKLVFRTTRTFNLRLKHISQIKEKTQHHELNKRESQSSMAKGKITDPKIMMSTKGKAAQKQSECLKGNIETVKQNVSNISVRALKDLAIVDDATDDRNEDKPERRSESDQSQYGSDRYRGKSQSTGNSQHSSPKGRSFSDRSREGNEEEFYTDDFNSFHSSDLSSTDPSGSPESSRDTTPRSPCHSDSSYNSNSGSEGFQSRHSPPAPSKATGSPQHSLMRTYVIRPRTRTLHVSSDDSDIVGSASSRRTRSRKYTVKAERSSSSDSSASS